MRCRPRLLVVVATAMLVAGCAAGAAATPSGSRSTTPQSRIGPATSPAPRVSAPDPAAVHANELGLVPVLMYHQVVAHPRDVYDQTPAHFRSELEALADDGYVPITAAELVDGRIDIPAGRHPVVLTFDDSTVSQFRLTAAGAPQAGTAVAILQSVAREHPGFTPTATFFVNDHPFGDATGKRPLAWLHDHGFDIGDHTASHANLGRLPTAQVQHEIGANARMIEAAVPGFAPRTLALPFGVFPAEPVLAHAGTYGGSPYRFAGVFLVGASPAYSPFRKGFDPFAIPRIRSEATGTAPAADRPFISDHYLAWLRQHPQGRYTSDGNPETVSFPRSYAALLAPGYRSRARPY